MANWCEGWVKFRGTLGDLKRFIACEFEQSEPFIVEDELSPCMREKTTFLKSLARTYVESDDVSRANYEVFCNDDGIGLFIIKLNHAWNVQRQGYNELAKKYNLDIRGKCYEAGCNFVEEFEVNRCGEDVFYKVYKFNDYSWECECPTLGG